MAGIKVLRKGLLGLTAAASLPVAGHAWALDVTVKGMSGAAADNVVNILADLEADSQSTRTRLDAVVKERAQQALQAYGYYNATLTTSYPAKDNEQVIITIQPGERTKITQLDVSLEGDAAKDDAFEKVMAADPLKVGDPLLHSRYDGFKSQLSTLALERGYFNSRFRQQRIEVRPWENSARIFLDMDSGTRYRFGHVHFNGSQIERQRLENMVPFETGDPYLAGDLATLNQNLGQTDWFRGVAVRPRVNDDASPAATSQWYADATGRETTADVTEVLGGPGLQVARQLTDSQPTIVPVDVELTPADRHQFEVGIGYATDVGPRTQFSWTMPWLNRYGHSLTNSLYLSAPEQRFSGEYTIPLANPLRDSYRVRYGLENVDNEDTQSFQSSVQLARHWEFSNGWVQDLYWQTTYEDFTQADQDDAVLLLYPGISWSRTRTRNPIFPTWGDKQQLTLEWSEPAWGSDARFVRTTFSSQWIRMLGSENRFVGRIGGGAMATNTFDKIPPSLRFFAGGDQSIRGYSYESLSPENDDGELLGGQHMLTSSIEYQRHVTGNFWGATFVDTGNAFDEWWPDALKTGAGVGVRWISPVGPIRFDIAHPFDDEEDSWRLHFSIGPEF
ncbi:autotransporter assembly complex protein TamA [Salinicola rhizosphaerae]|uniref:Translocation and assembly module subunit TamA n=1 Tax=Salinicola rhizosphaerae TaxID=1443141 RepID=A0ABQ3DQA6_9GAMM|nr:autotransporter assembly complex family protein [Salinicola rhizosphaerae]GHB09304.1 outer membrane protein assembly factor [Salinicola rhizosphaerae]